MIAQKNGDLTVGPIGKKLLLLLPVHHHVQSGLRRDPRSGHSKTPLCAQLAGGLVNVAMDCLFVRVFKNGVTGVAWASLISQSLAALLFLIVPRVNEIRGVAVCYPITWALTAACMLICYVQCIRKEKTIGSL